MSGSHADHGLPLITAHVQKIIGEVGERMQWIEGRLTALRTVASYLTGYPPRYAARQVGWLADALSLAPSTVTNELVVAYRRAEGNDHSVGIRTPRGLRSREQAAITPVTVPNVPHRD